MSESNMMSLNIDKDMIMPIIKEHTKAMMAQVLGDPNAIVERLINELLYTKVNWEGKTGKYDSDTPIVEYFFTKEIHTAIQEVIKEEVHNQSSLLRAKVKKAIRSDKGMQKLADAIMDALAERAGNAYDTIFKLEVHQRSDY